MQFQDKQDFSYTPKASKSYMTRAIRIPQSVTYIMILQVISSIDCSKPSPVLVILFDQ